MEPKIPPQNLIRQVQPDAPIRRPGIYKPVLMDVLIVAFALGLGYLYKQFIAGTLDYSLFLAGVAAFSVLSILHVFFTRSLVHRAWIILLEVAAFLGLFYGYDLRILGIAGALMFVFLFWGDAMGHTELEDTLEIGFFRTAMPALKKLTTALLLAFVVLYIPGLNQSTMFVSEANFQKFYDWAAGFMVSFYPEVNFSTSFEKFAEGVVRLELKNNLTFQKMSAAEQDQAIQQSGSDLATNIGKSFDMPVSGNELASSVLYRATIKLLDNWRIRFGNYFAIGWALAAFLVLRALGVIFYTIVGFLSFLVYQTLLASNFIHIFGETRTHEIIEY